MNVMHRFTLNSLRRNRKWTIVTVIGVIISTAMIVAVATLSESFLSLLRKEIIASDGNWHAAVEDATPQDIAALREDDFVAQTMLSRDIGYAMLEGSENANKPYLFVLEYDTASMEQNGITLLEGRLPQNSSEVVLSQHIETNGGVTYRVGDVLTLSIGERMVEDEEYDASEQLEQTSAYYRDSEVLVPQETKEYTIVGIIERPNHSVEPSWAPGYTLISYLDESKLGADERINISLLTDHIRFDFYDSMNALAENVGIPSEQVRFNTQLLRYYGVDPNDNMMETMYGLLLVIILIIMVASVSLIYNAFAISVSERGAQLGMLASIGATKRQKRKSVYFEGFIIGIIGIPIGILSGIAGTGILLVATGPLLSSFTSFRSDGLTLVVSPLPIIIAAFFAALTIFLSLYFPAWRASKITPIDAIRHTGEVKVRAKKLKTSRLTRLLFGFEGELALKNLKRSRKKYRATVLSLTISLVLFLTVSYYMEMMERMSNYTYDGINFDLSVFSGNDLTAEQLDTLYEDIATLPQTQHYTIQYSIPVYGEVVDGVDILTDEAKQAAKIAAKIDGKEPSLAYKLHVIDDEAFSEYAQSIGQDSSEYFNAQEYKAIVVNYAQGVTNGHVVSGDVIDAQSGDMLELVCPEAQSNIEIEIGALTHERPMGLFIQQLQANTQIALILPKTVAEELVATYIPNELAMGIQSYMFINSDDPDTLEKDVLSLAPEDSLYVNNMAEFAQSERNIMLLLSVFIYGFIILISLICIANIFNTVSTNVALRRKEFAMLRSVGMTPSGFNKMIRFESIFYGLKSLAYGVPISVGIAYLLHRMQTGVFQIEFALPWESYLIAVILIFFVVGTTMLYSTSKMKRENIIDALKADIS